MIEYNQYQVRLTASAGYELKHLNNQNFVYLKHAQLIMSHFLSIIAEKPLKV